MLVCCLVCSFQLCCGTNYSVAPLLSRLQLSQTEMYMLWIWVQCMTWTSLFQTAVSNLDLLVFEIAGSTLIVLLLLCLLDGNKCLKKEIIHYYMYVYFKCSFHSSVKPWKRRQSTGWSTEGSHGCTRLYNRSVPTVLLKQSIVFLSRTPSIRTDFYCLA